MSYYFKLDLMNKYLMQIMQRKTTYEFDGNKVKDGNVIKILEAGRWTPSVSNMQLWHFIVVREEETIKELLKTTFFGAFHSPPPLIIALVLESTIVGGEHVAVRNNKVSKREALLAIGMCGLNMAYEAQGLGISSCFLSPSKKADAILKLKENDSIPLLIGFGYEKKSAFQKERTRKELKQIVSFESFGEKGELHE